MFKVRKFTDVHTCSLKDRVYSLRQATSEVIGHIIKDRYNEPKSTYKPKEIIEDVQRNLGLSISYMKAWRSKEKAIKMIRGDASDSYNKLPSYLFVLGNYNPGSTIKLLRTDENYFMYAFVALYASIKGWEYCRPIVVVDGSFLKAAHKGTFLSASTVDAAGSILPLAYAIVDSENNFSWEWFFSQFREAYGEREDMCIISDRKESILTATSNVYPRVPHYACIWHLWNNVKIKYRKNEEKLYEIFFAMAKAYSVEEFNMHMEKVEQIDVRVKEYLHSIGYQKWSRAHSTANRAWTMTSNIAESLNGANSDARELPVTAFLQYMGELLEKWNNRCRQCANNTFTKLTEKYHKMLNANRLLAVNMKVWAASDYLFTVYHGDLKLIVNLKERTCTCKRFQMDELLCAHAIAVLKFKNINEEEDYCSAYYTKDYLERTYAIPIYPIPDERSWNIPPYVSEQVVLAPKGRRQAGRPKKSRHKASWESHPKRSKITCGLCGREGHNRATCSHPSKRN